LILGVFFCLLCRKSLNFAFVLKGIIHFQTIFKMTSAHIALFQQFTSLPLQEQLKLSSQINQFLILYFEKMTRDQKERLDKNDQNEWAILSKQGLNNAYSDNEPDYSL
jgi:hypothetical protein